MVDSVGFSGVSLANPALDLRVSGSGAAGSVADSGTAPATTATRPATFFSPSLRFDQSLDQLIIQFRDPDTGQVERQYPSRQVIQQYQQAEQQRLAAEAQARFDTAATGHAVNVQVTSDVNGQPIQAKPVPQAPPPATSAKPADTTAAPPTHDTSSTTTSRGITA